ncbi:MAG: EamA family transporter [Phycisphaerae bacterium]|nr:EamA family transporter [Phycisphaerae bacterium]NIW96006.1 EamA family transporter [Phycisphaerae bacterium]
MALASTFFCVAGCLIKCGSHIGPYRMAFFRFVIGFGLIAIAFMSGRITLVFNNKKLLFLRGLTGGIAILISLISITKLGLGKGMVLICSYPIFASTISAVFLKERLRLFDIGAILTAIVGIYFIAYDKEHGFSLMVFGKYELLAVLGAVIAGMAVSLIRKLHDTDSSLAIYFSQCVVGMWLVLGPSLSSEGRVGLNGVFILLGIGVTVTIGQLLMTEGFKYVPVKTGSLLLMLEPVLCYAAGVAIFREESTLSSGFGSALVIGACVVVLAGRKKKALPVQSNVSV